MLSRRLIKKQSGRRPLTALAIAGLLGSLLLAGGTALAVHDDSFPAGRRHHTARTRTRAAPGTPTLDWDGLFNADGTNKPRPSIPRSHPHLRLHSRRLRPGLQIEGWQERPLYGPCSLTASHGADLLYGRHDDVRDRQQGHPGHQPGVAVQPATTTSTARSTS